MEIICESISKTTLAEGKICIRAAQTGDVDAIQKLLEPFIETEIILPRTKDDIYQHLQEFSVATCNGCLLGTAAMHIYSSTLAEIRSLVVGNSCQGHGIGNLLVRNCEQRAAELGVSKLFALTYLPTFFESAGYIRVTRESLPHKIWTVCIHCSRFSDCDEVAVQKSLSSALP